MLIRKIQKEILLFRKMASAYVKCMKLFFGFAKYSSVSAMLIQLNLPSFNTVLHTPELDFVAD